jgi:hypothetical protein
MAFDYKKFYSELTKGLPGAISPEEVDFLKDQPMPSRSSRPDLFGDLSRVPLGREQAQNTAQMGQSKSNDMQEAFKSVMEGVPAFGAAIKMEGKQPIRKEDAMRLGQELQKSMKAKGSYLTASGAISGALTPVEAMTAHQTGMNESSDQYTKFGQEILEAQQDVSMGLPSRHGVQFMGGGKSGDVGPKDEKGNLIPQKFISAPQVGSKEYNQRLLEGSMPGVSSLNPYQQATAQSNIRGIEAQEKAAVEEAKKKQEAQQNPQAQQTSVGPVASTSTPSVMDNTGFAKIMTEEQYQGGVSFLKNIGMHKK